MKSIAGKDILLLLNGEMRNTAQVRKIARRAVVICADGGARHAAKLGLKPRIIIGDMDSLPKRLPRWKSAAFICDFDLNASDFEKALRFIARRRFARASKRIFGRPPAGGRTVWIAGVLGGRLDQQSINWALMERYSEDFHFKLAEGDVWIVGKGRHAVEAGKGRLVTLLAATPTARVTTRGLLYALRKGLLERSSRGLSNRAVSANASIEVHSGRVWVFRP